MKKPNKAEIERYYAEKALAYLGLAQVAVLSRGEDPPDVRVELEDGIMGVEVSYYHRDLAGRTSGLRHQEARVDEIEAAFDLVRTRFPDVMVDGRVFMKRSDRRVEGVSPNWLRLMPKKAEVERFVTELLEHARAHATEVTAARRVFNEFGETFPLLRQYVEKMELQSYSWTPIWNFDPCAKTHGFAKEQWMRHVERKAARIVRAREKYPGRFATYDEIWLLLASGPRSSQSVAATLDHFVGDNDLIRKLDVSPFDAVLVCQCWEETPLHEWRRGSGWRQVGTP